MDVATPALRILIADDEAGVRHALEAVLGRRGHSVTAVGSAAEAREEVARGRFDVALLDARMPGDGLVLRQELEAGALMHRTILMTGDVTTVPEGPEWEPLLPKPFDYDIMVELVEYVARDAARRERRGG